MIWFDLDNSPHVPLFRPIFVELNKLEHPYLVTARDFAQTKELLAFWNVPHVLIGTHGGRSNISKIQNLIYRAFQLSHRVKAKGIKLAVSHGSRTQLVAAKMLGIPSVLMLDYEYTEARIFNTLATSLLIPAYIPDKRLVNAGFNLAKVIRYEGFKEEIYLKDFVPDLSLRKKLGIDDEKILVTIRPPSTISNYHDPLSEELFRNCLEFFSSNNKVHCLIVNRTFHELGLIPPHLHDRKNISMLTHPVDGLQLIWNSDLVVSGGGTMNRESALLGVPTYSIFTGKRPYMDIYLSEQNRLTFIDSASKIQTIPVKKRTMLNNIPPVNKELASSIAQLLLTLEKEYN